MLTFAPCFFTIGNTCYRRATEGAGYAPEAHRHQQGYRNTRKGTERNRETSGIFLDLLATASGAKPCKRKQLKTATFYRA